MRDQVERHLERARLAARVAVIGTVIEVRPVVTALIRTMEKIYHDRDIAIEIDAPEHARFRGEQQDLEEMVGNLVDNACKWAQSRVAVEAFPERPDAGERAAVPAHRGRRRWTGPLAVGARAGGAARPAPRRDQAGLGARALDRGRARHASMAGGCRSAPRRSAACAPSWCCRERDRRAILPQKLRTTSGGIRMRSQARRLGTLGAVIAAALCGIEHDSRRRSDPAGWAASNMEPIGYSDLEGRRGAFKMTLKAVERPLVHVSRPSLASRLDHRRRHRPEEPDLREAHPRAGQHLDASR